MDLNELYQSIATFWEKISPLLYFHIAAILVLNAINGNNWFILERIEQFLLSERYTRWKKVLDEFSLRPAIPYTLLIVFFTYLSIVNNVLGTFGGWGPFSIKYSQTEFWEENRPLSQLVEMASYQSATKLEIWEIYSLEFKFIEQYKAQYPQTYETLTKWIWDEFTSWQKYYQLSILFFIFVIILAISGIKKSEDQTKRLIKITGILVLTLITIIFFRVKAEQDVEKAMNTDLFFVIEQLKMDPHQKKMEDTDLASLQCNLYLNLTGPTGHSTDEFWVSRILEKTSLFVRAMPATSPQTFVLLNQSLESNCQKSP